MTVDDLMALAEEYAHNLSDHLRDSATAGAPVDCGQDACRAALRAALESVVADAQRYRWLRAENREAELLVYSRGDALDAAIDAAMKP
jgi:hypothetical protein